MANGLRLDRVEADIKTLGNKSDGLDTKIDAVEAKLTGRIDSIELKLIEHDVRLSRIENDIQRLDIKIQNLDNKFEIRFTALDDKFEAKFDHLKNDMDEIKVAIGKLQTSNNIVIALVVALAAGLALQFFTK